MVRSEGTRSDRARSGGFTLTELLVVVSTICLLMSLLLPSLTRAQKQAERLHCLANQHQLSLAWLQYTADHDDKLCLPTAYTSDLKPYAKLKSDREPYTKPEEVFVCKSVEGRAGSISYAISNTLGGEFRDGVKPCDRFHQISHPGERMVFADKETRSSNCFWPVLRSDKKWVWRPWSWHPALQGMTARHANGCNLTFADGHGEQIHWRDDRTRRLIKGLMGDAYQASQENTDLDYMVRVLGATAPEDSGD